MQELKPERCYMSFSFLVANTLFERDENRTNLFNPNSPTQLFFENLKRTSHNVAIRCRVSWAHTLPPWTASHGSGADSLGVRVTWCACERLWSSWTTWPKFSLRCWRRNPPCYVPQRPKVLDYWHLDPTKSFGTFHKDNLGIFSYVAPTTGVRCWFSQAGMFVGVFRSWFLEAVFGQIFPTPTKSFQLISEFFSMPRLWSFLKTSLQMRWKVSRFRC